MDRVYFQLGDQEPSLQSTTAPVLDCLFSALYVGGISDLASFRLFTYSSCFIVFVFCFIRSVACQCRCVHKPTALLSVPFPEELPLNLTSCVCPFSAPQLCLHGCTLLVCRRQATWSLLLMFRFRMTVLLIRVLAFGIPIMFCKKKMWCCNGVSQLAEG